MRPPGSQDRPGGCRFEVRGVAALPSPPLWAGAWETSRAAGPDTDWVWHCVQEARRSFSLALFFPLPSSFISKRASFIVWKGPSSALHPSPPGSDVLFFFFFVFLSLLDPRSYIDSLVLFFFSLPYTQIQTHWTCVSFVFVFYRPSHFGCWPVKFDARNPHIKKTNKTQ